MDLTTRATLRSCACPRRKPVDDVDLEKVVIPNLRVVRLRAPPYAARKARQRDVTRIGLAHQIVDIDDDGTLGLRDDLGRWIHVLGRVKKLDRKSLGHLDTNADGKFIGADKSDKALTGERTSAKSRVWVDRSKPRVEQPYRKDIERHGLGHRLGHRLGRRLGLVGHDDAAARYGIPLRSVAAVRRGHRRSRLCAPPSGGRANAVGEDETAEGQGRGAKTQPHPEGRGHRIGPSITCGLHAVPHASRYHAAYRWYDGSVLPPHKAAAAKQRLLVLNPKATKKTLRRRAIAVRRRLEPYFAKRGGGVVCTQGACAHASEILARDLRRAGYDAMAVSGVYVGADPDFRPDLGGWDEDLAEEFEGHVEYGGDASNFEFHHYYVLVEGEWIVDLTSDQFHPDDPAAHAVVVVREGDPRYP